MSDLSKLLRFRNLLVLVSMALPWQAVADEQSWYDSTAVPNAKPIEEPIVPGSVPLAESSVGFIDSALPMTNLRIRYDANFKADRNTRAEYLFAFPQPVGRGYPVDEVRIDEQKVTTSFEYALSTKLSAFAEIGAHFVDPDFNANASGFDDMNVGVKWAFWWTEHRIFTAQLRGYLPTGDADKGLGVGHGAIEPGILLMHRISERFRMEKEVRLWIPLDGAKGDAGSVLKYGISSGYDVVSQGNLRISPVAELVGWTVVGGHTRYITPAGIVVQDAYADTIFNGTLGVRVVAGDCGRHQFFAGYAHALTGETWFRDGARIEYRLAF